MSNITGTKLKHTIHLEDLLYDGGDEGADLLIRFIKDIQDQLSGHSDGKNIKTKYDGCFSPETLVKTKQFGIIPIVEVISKVNSKEHVEVLGFDFKSDQNQFTEVKNALAKSSKKDWVELILEDDTSIFCTKDHLFYTENRGYVEAQSLIETDELKVDGLH